MNGCKSCRVLMIWARVLKLLQGIWKLEARGIYSARSNPDKSPVLDWSSIRKWWTERLKNYCKLNPDYLRKI